MTGMAELTSRGMHVTLQTMPATVVGGWCETCRTHSTATWPLRGITDGGVYELGTVTACALHSLEDDA